MPFIAQGKTNRKFLLIVVFLGFFAMAGTIIYMQYAIQEIVSLSQFVEINKPEKEIADWKIYEISIPNFANDEPNNVINSIMQNFNNSSSSIKFSNPIKSSQWWISDDGWSIIDPNAISITAQGNFTEGYYSSPNSLAMDLNDKISEIFLHNGFEVNATNTSKSITDKEFYDYVVAFQKGETRCTATTNGDGGKYTIDCSNRFQEAYMEQIPYLKALGIDKRDVIVSVKSRIGDFVWLSVHGRRTGYAALVKDKNGEITLIFTGQEAPPCNLMINNQVPKEVYGACYDESGNIVE